MGAEIRSSQAMRSWNDMLDRFDRVIQMNLDELQLAEPQGVVPVDGEGASEEFSGVTRIVLEVNARFQELDARVRRAEAISQQLDEQFGESETALREWIKKQQELHRCLERVGENFVK